MRSQEDLQVALRERYRRLLVASHSVFNHETQMTRNWISGKPALVALLAEAAQVEPDLDASAWKASLSDGLNWPSQTEDGRATLAWSLLNDFADSGGRGGVIEYGRRLSSSRNLNDMARSIAEKLYGPLFEYLIEHVAAESSVLYTLDRFVRNVEWFTRDQLYAAYLADTANGEAVYDKALRHFLFSEGINMPFSQAKSPSGVSDVLARLDSEDPLVCEVKLFTGDKRPIGTGLNQAVLYAQDHGKHAAYLVVLNLTDQALEFPNDGGEKQVPPFLDVGGVRVYLIGVRALPPATSASKAGKPKPVSFSRDALTTAP